MLRLKCQASTTQVQFVMPRNHNIYCHKLSTNDSSAYSENNEKKIYNNKGLDSMSTRGSLSGLHQEGGAPAQTSTSAFDCGVINYDYHLLGDAVAS